MTTLNLGNVLKDIDADYKKREKITKNALKGVVPMLIIKKSGFKKDNFTAVPFTKEFVWLHEIDGKKLYNVTGRSYNREDVALDNNSIIGKQLEEINKQRKALYLKEQRILKKYYEALKVIKIDEELLKGGKQ